MASHGRRVISCLGQDHNLVCFQPICSTCAPTRGRARHGASSEKKGHHVCCCVISNRSVLGPNPSSCSTNQHPAGNGNHPLSKAVQWPGAVNHACPWVTHSPLTQQCALWLPTHAGLFLGALVWLNSGIGRAGFESWRSDLLTVWPSGQGSYLLQSLFYAYENIFKLRGCYDGQTKPHPWRVIWPMVSVQQDLADITCNCHSSRSLHTEGLTLNSALPSISSSSSVPPAGEVTQLQRLIKTASLSLLKTNCFPFNNHGSSTGSWCSAF